MSAAERELRERVKVLETRFAALCRCLTMISREAGLHEIAADFDAVQKPDLRVVR